MSPLACGGPCAATVPGVPSLNAVGVLKLIAIASVEAYISYSGRPVRSNGRQTSESRGEDEDEDEGEDMDKDEQEQEHEHEHEHEHE